MSNIRQFQMLMKPVNAFIDQAYKEDAIYMANVLAEIKEKFGHLLVSDSDSKSDSDEMNALSKEPETSPKRKSPQDTATPSQKNTKTVTEPKNQEEKKAPVREKAKYLSFDEINLPPHLLKKEPFLETVRTSEPKSSTASTIDMDHPLGTSTPNNDDSSTSSSSEDDVEKYQTSMKLRQRVAKPDNRDLKSQNRNGKPVAKFFRTKPTVTKIKPTKIEDAQKKKLYQMNTAVELQKRKREERANRYALLREMKDPKKKEEKTKKLETKENKNGPLKPLHVGVKKTVLQYDIDHVVEGALTDDEENPKNPVPKWATAEGRKHTTCLQAWLDKEETIYKWFSKDQLQAPDLNELFTGVVMTRKRTSSAIWNR